METIGRIISDTRKLKGLTQEELSELSNVNLRTIQRVENNENVPRSKTLILLCDVLQLNYVELLNRSENVSKGKNYWKMVIDGLFLVILNLALMGIFGYLTLDSEANLNSKFGGLLLSIFLPLVLVWKTQYMSGTERILKFGTGFIFYIVLVTINLGFPTGFKTGLFVCLAIALAIFYYGNKLVELKR